LIAKKILKIALVGNPNIGKSSLFNALTGLNQKVGNFPGVTVDKKTGKFDINEKLAAELIDLPGMYSLYPKSIDESIAAQQLYNSDDLPDMVIVLVDATNLKRNLFFAKQIIDLGYPTIVCLTMLDIASQKGIIVDTSLLSSILQVEVIGINPRINTGIKELKLIIAQTTHQESNCQNDEFSEILSEDEIKNIKQENASTQKSIYLRWHEILKNEVPSLNKADIQAREVSYRFQKVDELISKCIQVEHSKLTPTITKKIDDVLLHPVWGMMIMLVVLFLVFQGIFSLSSYPMDGVELLFSWITEKIDWTLNDSWFKSLVVNGILPGISGVVVFIPQIMILFGCITLLEDTGYMARISFLTDRFMRSVGLNGKAVMPLVGGVACAVPAIMATRTIQNPKERLITIMVTPLMSCSARLPVYTMIIALVIPDTRYFYFFNLQGLVLMGLYLLGLIAALVVAKVMSLSIRQSAIASFFMQELPEYHAPRWKNLWVSMIEKSKVFLFQAGKIIFFVSIILWLLCSFGPSSEMQQINNDRETLLRLEPTREAEINAHFSTLQLEHSYAGKIGKFIEPAIKPLGFDWKIGIAIITSFAAREVFVGTMATLYSVQNYEDTTLGIREKLSEAKWADGTPVYTLASGISLLLFYAFALQCVSTLAITKRETKSWKYPIIQFVYMAAMAWIASFVAFQVLS
jgi:ferrous iron transport protein B